MPVELFDESWLHLRCHVLLERVHIELGVHSSKSVRLLFEVIILEMLDDLWCHVRVVWSWSHRWE